MSRFNFSSTKLRSRFSFQQDSEDNTGRGDGLPTRLKDYDQWLVTQKKEPVVPSKGWQKSVNHLSFTEAQDKAEQLGGELAFCFTEGDPFVGFDLDDVKVDGTFTEEAISIVRRLDSYTEISSSGTGLHVITEGEKLHECKTRGNLTEAGHLEVYDKNRYFVLTFNIHKGRRSIKRRPTIVRTVQEDYLPKSESNHSTGTQKPLSEQEYTRGSSDVAPEQVHQTIRAYVESGRHDVDEQVLRLWKGSNEGYPSPSEADMAFVAQLYYWCKGDPCLIDECFRASGRMRPKWNEKRRSQTYGEMTIQRVCRSNSETFGGRICK